MELKDFLKKLGYSTEQIDAITEDNADATVIDDAIKAWEKNFVEVIVEKPEVKKMFRDSIAPQALTEGKVKQRKIINSAHSLGLSNKQLTEMEDAEWETLIKSSLTKSDDDEKVKLKSKVDELTTNYQKLEDDFEKSKAETEKTWKSKYSSKVAKAKISDFLSTLDNTVIDKSELPDIIEAKRAKEGLQIEVDDNDNIILTKDGNRLFNNNKPVEVDEWLKGLTTPYITKTPPPPGSKIPGAKGEENTEIQKSKRALELEAKLQPA